MRVVGTGLVNLNNTTGLKITAPLVAERGPASVSALKVAVDSNEIVGAANEVNFPVQLEASANNCSDSDNTSKGENHISVINDHKNSSPMVHVGQLSFACLDLVEMGERGVSDDPTALTETSLTARSRLTPLLPPKVRLVFGSEVC